MAKKFMVVKPMACCKAPNLIGRVYEACHHDLEFCVSECWCCSAVYDLDRPVYTRISGNVHVIDEALIMWLPDEDDVLEFDKEKELELI